MDTQTSRRLKILGMILFLLGLLNGFILMQLKNPRMGLAAHLEAVMNGTFLVVCGFIWTELHLSKSLRKILLVILVYGAFSNWIFTLLSAVFGTSQTTPISGAGFAGTTIQENLVTAGLASVGITMLFSLLIIIYGLRGKLEQAKN